MNWTRFLFGHPVRTLVILAVIVLLLPGGAHFMGSLVMELIRQVLGPLAMLAIVIYALRKIVRL